MPIADATLAGIERTAVEIATLAGAEIIASLGRTLSVRYKGEAEDASFRDPVSEVDHHVEVLIRALLADRFPDHDIIGEEIDEGGARSSPFLWAIDPVDGTANFVNGFPLFAASIGVLHHGEPLAGAVWCSTSHALRPGVYHARTGGRLFFEGDAIDPKGPNPSIRRRLGGEPARAGERPWDVRTTGSAALECAFVAAGLLQVARFATPNIWDVAGGVALVRAGGGEAWARADGGGWAPLARFPADPTGWRGPMMIGERAAMALLAREG